MKFWHFALAVGTVVVGVWIASSGWIPNPLQKAA